MAGLLAVVDLAVELNLSEIGVVVEDITDPVRGKQDLPEFLARFGSAFSGLDPGVVDDVCDFSSAVALEVQLEDLFNDPASSERIVSLFVFSSLV
jgi:hypothetical protein